MPQSKPAPGIKADSPAASRTALGATAQLLTFEPGLYSVDFTVPRSIATNTGLNLPCVRLEPVPSAIANPGRAFVSVMAEGGWLFQGNEPTFVRAVGGRAGVMLTVYKAAADTASPELRIRLVTDTAAGTATSQPAPPKAEPQTSDVAFAHMVHVQGSGDIRVAGGQWAGRGGSGVPIEGFSLLPPPEFGPATLEYQAILGDQWNTPWTRAGQFCGSRGMSLPILGVRIRLSGKDADSYECTYWGSFVGRPTVGPIHDGEACIADQAFMEALRVVISRRPAAQASPTPAAEAPPSFPPAGSPDQPAKVSRRGRGTIREVVADPGTVAAQPQDASMPLPPSSRPTGSDMDTGVPAVVTGRRKAAAAHPVVAKTTPRKR